MDTVTKIRKIQSNLIAYINESFDEILLAVEEYPNNVENEEYERVYSIMNTSALKGKKSIAVTINGNRIICPTWKRVFYEVLAECNKSLDNHRKLMGLRNKYLGTKRIIISDKPGNMKSPLKIDESLYIETHYDTKSLMDLLLRILNDLKYDYTNIIIAGRS
jgi:hypothetical protein